MEIHFEAFPQLKEGRGYELLRANQSRILEVDGYTPSYLTGQGKVYIRPIQRDLSLKPILLSSVSMIITHYSVCSIIMQAGGRKVLCKLASL